MSDVTSSVTIGLLADPDQPTDLAKVIAEELPGILAHEVSDRVEWRVEVASFPFTVGQTTTARSSRW